MKLSLTSFNYLQKCHHVYEDNGFDSTVFELVSLKVIFVVVTTPTIINPTTTIATYIASSIL